MTTVVHRLPRRSIRSTRGHYLRDGMPLYYERTGQVSKVRNYAVRKQPVSYASVVNSAS